eukprot:TRINITY_DN9457_c0_g1_i1.p3 TRINITY_DN9457_c0_g1~~TRINITY_DN9457_c0_g1_i1.p3  ORF type:complete len:153 (+),score=15.43 TRINITY_DN9457_c0_g1_i1:227-685(+)
MNQANGRINSSATIVININLIDWAQSQLIQFSSQFLRNPQKLKKNFINPNPCRVNPQFVNMSPIVCSNFSLMILDQYNISDSQLQYSNFFEFKGFFLIKYEIKMNNDMIKIIISHIIQFENYALKIWFDEYVNLLISNHKKKIASNHNQIYQ